MRSFLQNLENNYPGIQQLSKDEMLQLICNYYPFPCNLSSYPSIYGVLASNQTNMLVHVAQSIFILPKSFP
jgi:hypothetical protein